MMIPRLLPTTSWVLKKELTWIPFFGWALLTTSPIAIDRKSGSSAVEQVKVRGKKRLDEGNWICMFPEGTRGRRKNIVWVLLCLQNTAGYPVYPLAHNAGECWPRHSYIKLPGTITLSIGKPFSVEGLTAEEINDKVRNWIEAEIEKMPPAIVEPSEELVEGFIHDPQNIVLPPADIVEQEVVMVRPPAKPPLSKSQLFSGVLESHNKIRAKHRLQPLKWSDKLARYSQQWANHLGSGSRCTMRHRSGQPPYWREFILVKCCSLE
ncbi:1-acyl-sn-glycerol-3-phosphate acyltransferase [Nymphon striatum]|nr:1-acyl-sn-glycerol-3-phosphate acyltransferase [Nymphon striatum]